MQVFLVAHPKGKPVFCASAPLARARRADMALALQVPLHAVQVRELDVPHERQALVAWLNETMEK